MLVPKWGRLGIVEVSFWQEFSLTLSPWNVYVQFLKLQNSYYKRLPINVLFRFSVKVFTTHGADLEATDFDGRTSFMLNASHGLSVVVEAPITAGNNQQIYY